MTENIILTKDTKISKASERIPQLLDLIYYFGSNISKLKKDFVSKSLGMRTTLEQLAHIENIKTEDLIAYLNLSAGLSARQHSDDEDIESAFGYSQLFRGKPDFLGENSEGQITASREIIEVDVRDEIVSGEDPIGKIKQGISRLTEDNAVKLINYFEPVPLYYAMAKKGIKHWAEYRNNLWYAYFYK